MKNATVDDINEIIESKEAFSWILEHQTELRSELLAFYKKELKEIYISLTSIGTGGIDDFAQKALESVERQFIEQWQRSYDLITPCNANRNTGGNAKIFPRLESVNSNSNNNNNLNNKSSRNIGSISESSSQIKSA